jgi:hypothetical protein
MAGAIGTPTSCDDGFIDTIDQVFGYTAWRDTKLAIVMIVREKRSDSRGREGASSF